MTKLRALFGFELGYQLRRVSTRIYFGLFLAFALGLDLIMLADARNDGYWFNAPIVTGLITVIESMLALLITAGVAGDAATRDGDLRIDSLLFTTPLRKASYLGGRFLGAFALNALLLLAVPIALLLAKAAPIAGPELFGPFRARDYLTAYFFLAVPNAFVATAILFSIAILTRRAITAYAGGAVLFFGAFLADGYVGVRLGNWRLAGLLDPLGYTTLHALWKTYNPLQKKTLPLPLDGTLLANRFLWLALAAAMLGAAYARFRFAYADDRRHSAGWRKRRDVALDDEGPASRWSARSVPVARRAFGVRTRIRQLLAVTTESLRALHKSRGWWIVPFVAVIFIATAAEILEVELGTPGAATTGRVANIFAAGEIARLVALLIAVSAGELIWRERDARMNAIADVAPIPESLSYLGKLLGLVLMLAVTELIFLASGVTVQLMLGYFRFDIPLYLQMLFGFQFTGYVLLAMVALLIHALVNQKYVGNVLAVVAYIALQTAPELSLEHKLLLYGSAPLPPYSEMSGFGNGIGPWLWFMLYWAGWALLFGVATYLFWMRGEERGVRWRVALARRRLTRWPVAIGLAALAIIAGAGGFVFYNTNVLGSYRTASEEEARSADYERRYGKYASLPQPVLAATSLRIELHPSRGTGSIHGSYRLDNRSAVTVDAIHLTIRTDVETEHITFDRPSRVALADRDLGYRIHALERPLQPGESLRMEFDVAFPPPGFTNDGPNPSVVPNGSWIEHRGGSGERRWLPIIGYQPTRELTNESARREHSLPERPRDRSLENVAARQETAWNEKIDFEAVIGTDAGQIAVAPGSLRRQWSENGREYFHYVTDAPITNSYAIFSAKYAIHRAKWRDVAIEIYHHPSHTANLERMVRGAQASLDCYTRWFTPYPHRQLRMVEFPTSGRSLGLTSFPALVRYSEGYALVRPEADTRGIDLPFAVMAHELGHQWWGHQIVPAHVEGGALLSESLAWYSALSVVEKTLGRDHLLRLLDIMRSQYLAPHETRSVPLLRAGDWLDGYRTGPFAMFALRESVGEERVNIALRNLLAKFDPSRPPYPTSLDLYAELRAVTPPEHRQLLVDLFERITFWDLQTKNVDVQRAGNAWHVTLRIEAQKLVADASGKEKPAPMNDAILVAVFDAEGKPLHRAPHWIRSGTQTITVVVPRPPARAGIDPDHVLLDRKPEDNVLAVTP